MQLASNQYINDKQGDTAMGLICTGERMSYCRYWRYNKQGGLYMYVQTMCSGENILKIQHAEQLSHMQIKYMHVYMVQYIYTEYVQ